MNNNTRLTPHEIEVIQGFLHKEGLLYGKCSDSWTAPAIQALSMHQSKNGIKFPACNEIPTKLVQLNPVLQQLLISNAEVESVDVVDADISNSDEADDYVEDVNSGSDDAPDDVDSEEQTAGEEALKGAEQTQAAVGTVATSTQVEMSNEPKVEKTNTEAKAQEPTKATTAEAPPVAPVAAINKNTINTTSSKKKKKK